MPVSVAVVRGREIVVGDDRQVRLMPEGTVLSLAQLDSIIATGTVEWSGPEYPEWTRGVLSGPQQSPSPATGAVPGRGTSWWQQWWFIAVALIAFGPLGFVPLWMSPVPTKRAKVGITVGVSVLVVVLGACIAATVYSTLMVAQRTTGAATAVLGSISQGTSLDGSGKQAPQPVSRVSVSDGRIAMVVVAVGKDGFSYVPAPGSDVEVLVDGTPLTPELQKAISGVDSSMTVVFSGVESNAGEGDYTFTGAEFSTR